MLKNWWAGSTIIYSRNHAVLDSLSPFETAGVRVSSLRSKRLCRSCSLHSPPPSLEFFSFPLTSRNIHHIGNQSYLRSKIATQLFNRCGQIRPRQGSIMSGSFLRPISSKRSRSRSRSSQRSFTLSPFRRSSEEQTAQQDEGNSRVPAFLRQTRTGTLLFVDYG